MNQRILAQPNSNRCSLDDGNRSGFDSMIGSALSTEALCVLHIGPK
jgi:hypothetical protein